MLDALLKKYNRRRVQQYFQSPLFHTRRQYAFVGVGMHSLNNYYPLLRYFNIPLKYICTRQSDWNSQLSPLFPAAVFTHDITQILNDPAVAGILVCADPDEHYALAGSVLGSGKALFIEKPPCRRLDQLRHLIAEHPDALCKVGLQRRYWPANDAVKKKCSRAISYIYRFQTGSYPQGDPLTELFIHPLDYCHYLFGECRLQSLSVRRDNAGLTAQLHLEHANDLSGLIELSTRYTWNDPIEQLSVNTDAESLLIEYPGSVRGNPKPARVLHLPTERLFRRPKVTRGYYNGGPSLIPAMEYQTLITQGFFAAIESFVNLVEEKDSRETRSDLPSLIPTYELLEKISKA
ncbi:MAG TPA: Gfo/Idh/MocA family oxidoreductase [Puia sp.]|jgi:virulence factor|nr:Gfo/Idh/MocA family oxidoreductase [Puia sp.]